jgi:hypothetical protein
MMASLIAHLADIYLERARSNSRQRSEDTAVQLSVERALARHVRSDSHGVQVLPKAYDVQERIKLAFHLL